MFKISYKVKGKKKWYRFDSDGDWNFTDEKIREIVGRSNANSNEQPIEKIKIERIVEI